MKKLVFATMAVITILALASCDDGGSTTSQKPTVTSVTVSGGSTSIEQGKTSSVFNAVVAGNHSPAQTVTWSLVSGATGDTPLATTVATINSTARTVTVVATAEVGTTFRVKATSTFDTTKSGYSGLITVALATTVTGVTVTGGSTSVSQGETSLAFNAAVAGNPSPAQTVTWSLVSGETGDTALATTVATFDSDTRKVTVATTAAVDTKFRVKATSTADTTKSGYSAVVTVTAARTLVGIEIENPPSAEITTVRQYVGTLPTTVGGWTGLSVVAKYDDNSSVVLAASDITVNASAVNINSATTQKVKVGYQGKEDEFDVIVKAYTGIRLVSTDVTTTYYQHFDTAVKGLDTLTVWAQHTDFATDYRLSGEGDEEYTVNSSAVVFTTAGTPKITVTWKEKSADIGVTVVELSGITTGEIPYHGVGDVLPTGLDLIEDAVVLAVYADDEEFIINELLVASDIAQKGSPTTVTGGDLYTFTITWHSQTTDFTFEVTSLEFLDSITVGGPYKTTYYQFFDTEFNPTGLTVTPHYSKGTSKAADADNIHYNYNQNIFETSGPHNIIVSYTDLGADAGGIGAGGTRTQTIVITVIAAESLKIVLENDEFKVVPTAAEARAAIKSAKVVYADDEEKDITLTESMIQVDTTNRRFLISWHGVIPAAPVVYFLLEQVDFYVSVKTFHEVGVGFEDEHQLGNIHITGAPVKIVITGSTTYATIRWYLNGVLNGSSTTKEFTIDPKVLSLGRNVISAEVVLDGVTYRKNFVFTIVL